MVLQTYPFHQVDVFTDTPYYGNPVAVVNCLDSKVAPPTQEAMERFAKWTNLSETTFLLPPSTSDSADYRLKIFTPATELPFAGHPTLGSCHSFLRHLGADERAKLLQARKGKLVQECGIGQVELKVSTDVAGHDGTISFVAPNFIKHGPVEGDALDRICASFQLDRNQILDSHWISNGPPWIGIKLKDAQAVLNLRPQNVDSIRDLFVGVIGPYPSGKNIEGDAVAHEVRAFVFEDVGEDPVTGSLNAGFAMWLHRTGQTRHLGNYVNSQGAILGRKGRVSVTVEDSSDLQSRIWIGGKNVLCIDGTVSI